MKLSRDEVAAIAKLARLALTEAEQGRLGDELGAILEHMARLAEVPTDGIEPLTHAVPMALRLRPDVVEPSLAVSDALGGTRHVADDCFEVPPILPGAA